MAGPGRPTKFDPVVAERICSGLSEGAYLRDVCALAGVEYRTAQRWLELGQKTKREPYHSFAMNVAHARAQFSLLLTRTMRATGETKDWKALAWLAERTQPRKYGQHLKVQVDEELSGFLGRLKGKLPDDVYATVLAVALGEAGEGGAGEDPGEPDLEPGG